MSNENGRVSFGQLPVQKVVDMWPDIYDIGIEPALPPTSFTFPERRGNVLAAIQQRRITVWVGMSKGVLNCIVTTAPNEDSISGDNNLLIYSLVFVRKISPTDMKWGFEILKAQAKKLGYGKLIAYSNNDFIKEFFTSQGGNETAILEIEV